MNTQTENKVPKTDQSGLHQKAKLDRQKLKTQANKDRREKRKVRRKQYNAARFAEHGFHIIGDSSSGFTIKNSNGKIIQLDDMPERFTRYSDAYRALRGAGIPAKLIA